jgi:hypothetical protein
MNYIRVILFLAIILTIIYTAGYINYAVLKTYFSAYSWWKYFKYTYVIVASITPLLLIGARILEQRFDLQRLAGFDTFFGAMLGLLLNMFVISCVIGIALLLLKIFSLQIPVFVIGGLYIFVIVITLYGISSAFRIKEVTYTIDTVPSLAGKKIILFSDTHAGSIYSSKTINKVVNKINQEKPDFALFAGDAIDGPKINYEETFKGLALSSSPVFYTPGNHEYINEESEKVIKTIGGYTTLLRDNSTVFEKHIILGIDYKSTYSEDFAINKINEAKNIHGDKPVIVILHDPKYSDLFMKHGASLVVSGHTHRGQVFPINLIVKRIYKDKTHGVYTRFGNTGITTSGVGLALVPMRIGTNSEIVILHFK